MSTTSSIQQQQQQQPQPQQQQQQKQQQHTPTTLPSATTNFPPSDASSSLIQKLALANEQAWLNSGNLAELMGDTELSMKAYEAALRHNPYSIPVLTQIAALCRAKEQFPRAVEYFHQILKIENANGEIWGALGHCYLMMDELQQAYSAYQQALYHLPNPKEPKLWYGIGILYDRYGSLDHAEEAFSAVMRMDPKFENANEIYFRLGIIYKQQGKHDLSLQCFHYILHNPPRPLTEIDIWFQIGHVHEQQKEYTSAKEAYERVLAQNPSHAKVLQQLGWLYHQSDAPFCNEETACQFLTRSLGVDPSDAQSWYLLGRCYMAQQEHNKAYEAYQQAVYRDGRNPTFWCSIGVLYYQINQYRDALDAYSRAIRLNPYIAEVWYDLGTLYESCNNQKADAIDAYQRAEHLDPTNPHIKQRLQLLRTHGSSLGGMTSAPQDLHPAIQPSSPAPFNLAHAGQSQLGIPSQIQAGPESTGYPRRQPMTMDGRPELRPAPELQHQEMVRSLHGTPMHVANEQKTQGSESGHGLPSIARRSTSPYPGWPQPHHQQTPAPYGVAMERIPDITGGSEGIGRPAMSGDKRTSKGAQADRLLSVPGAAIHSSSPHLHGIQQVHHKPQGNFSDRDTSPTIALPSGGHPPQVYQDQLQQHAQHAHTQHAHPQQHPQQSQMPPHSPQLRHTAQKHHLQDHPPPQQDTESADGEARRRPHSSPTRSPTRNSFPPMTVITSPNSSKTNQPHGYPLQQQQYPQHAYPQKHAHPSEGHDPAQKCTLALASAFAGCVPTKQEDTSGPAIWAMVEGETRTKREEITEENAKDAKEARSSNASPSSPHRSQQQQQTEQPMEPFREANRHARSSMDPGNVTLIQPGHHSGGSQAPSSTEPASASASGSLSPSATTSPVDQPDGLASAMRLSRPIDEDYDDGDDGDNGEDANEEKVSDDIDRKLQDDPSTKHKSGDNTPSAPSATSSTSLTTGPSTANPELKRGPPSPHGAYLDAGALNDSEDGRKKARNRSPSPDGEKIKIQKIEGESWKDGGDSEGMQVLRIEGEREEGEVEEDYAKEEGEEREDESPREDKDDGEEGEKAEEGDTLLPQADVKSPVIQ